MPNLLKSRRHLVLVVFLLVGGVALIRWYVTLGTRTQIVGPEASLPRGLQEEAVQIQEERPREDGLKEARVETRASLNVLSETTKELILSCTQGVSGLNGISQSSEFSSLDEYLERAVSPTVSRTLPHIEYRNVHVRTPSSEILRLHVTQQATADGTDERLGLKLFTTGEDGLPVPQPLPEEFEALSTEEGIERFKTFGEVLLDETAESRSWDDQTGARLLIRNGVVEEAQLFFVGGSLACGVAKDAKKAMTCQCLGRN